MEWLRRTIRWRTDVRRSQSAIEAGPQSLSVSTWFCRFGIAARCGPVGGAGGAVCEDHLAFIGARFFRLDSADALLATPPRNRG